MKVFKKIEDLNIEYYRLFEDKANCIDFLSKKFSKKIDKAILNPNFGLATLEVKTIIPSGILCKSKVNIFKMPILYRLLPFLIFIFETLTIVKAITGIKKINDKAIAIFKLPKK